MGENVTIVYYGRNVEVSEEVADFLEADNRRLRSQARRDRRWLASMEDPDAVLDTKHCTGYNYLMNLAIRNIEIQNLKALVKELPEEEQNLLRQRYYLEMTQQEIADSRGISKMAVCKRLQKLHIKLRIELLSFMLAR